MKLNNHGWGLKDMIIYFSIILFLLIFVTILVHSFYTSVNKEQKLREDKIYEEVVEKPFSDDDNKSNNYDYYYQKEIQFKNQVINYINDKNIDVSSGKMIDLQILINEKYIDSIIDTKTGNTCLGYAKVLSNVDVTTYISCDNYVTEGY